MADRIANRMEAIFKSVVDKLGANLADIGSPATIGDRDEDPMVVANDGQLPAVYAIPLIEGYDDISMTMGSQPVAYHDFPISVVGYYRADNTYPYNKTVRRYAYNALELFSNHGDTFGNAWVYHASIETGYFTAIDYIIHYFVLELHFKALVEQV